MAKACLAWVWPWPTDRPQQGLPGALESSPARVLPGVFIIWPHVDSLVVDLCEEPHATRHVLFKSWSLTLSMVSELSTPRVVALLVSSQAALARSLPGASQVASARLVAGRGPACLLLLATLGSCLDILCTCLAFCFLPLPRHALP